MQLEPLTGKHVTHVSAYQGSIYDDVR